MHSLPLFVKLAGRKVLLIGEGEAADAKARLIERAGGIIVRVEQEVGPETALAFIAFDDESQAAETAGRLRARGILVNVVDKPNLCDFTTPAIVDRSPVLIAIGTGGASAGLAKALRQRLERWLPQNLGALADRLKTARPIMKSKWPISSERRRAIDHALAEDGPLDPFSEAAVGNVTDWLNQNHRLDQLNTTVTLQLNSYDPDDLTLRMARLLGEADHIIYSATCPSALLNRARADAARHLAHDNTDEQASKLNGLILILQTVIS